MGRTNQTFDLARVAMLTEQLLKKRLAFGVVFNGFYKNK